MANAILSAAILAELQRQSDLLAAAVAPVREKHAALEAMRAEIDVLNTEVRDFETNGNADDETALQRANSKSLKAGVLEGRIKASEAALEKGAGNVAELLPAAGLAILAAHEAHRVSQLERIAAALRPFYLEDFNAMVAAKATDFAQAYYGPARRINTIADSTNTTPVATALELIAAMEALLAGKDLVGVENFAERKAARMSQVKALRAQAAKNQEAAERENAESESEEPNAPELVKTAA